METLRKVQASLVQNHHLRKMVKRVLKRVVLLAMHHHGRQIGFAEAEAHTYLLGKQSLFHFEEVLEVFDGVDGEQVHAIDFDLFIIGSLDHLSERFDALHGTNHI